MKRILILLRQLKEFQSYIFNSVLELNWAQLLHKTRVIKNIFDVKSNKKTISFDIINTLVSNIIQLIYP